MKRAAVGVLVLGLLALGCGDDPDEDDVDSGVDAGGGLDAGGDAGVEDDAGMVADATAGDAGGDGGGETTYTVPLTTGEEVPVCSAAGSGAAGSVMITISADESMIIVMDLTFEGLSGPATMAHVHAGAPGMAGPIVLDLGASPTSGLDRTFTAADYPSPPPSGAPASFAAFVDAMRAGDTYVNVHTAACAPGEIRGQID